ncbi:MAG: GNAT family N-acetyltransferase [Anaerolineales bacterium]|jgi:ribosomal-protein-alanine N-acetyltransferase|nr:GNAT family N-acetyltransferase [Anaerolineales bacterium]
MIKISHATLLDLSALRRLEQVCFPKDAWPMLDLIAALSFPGVIRLKATENEKMVGFIAGDPRPSEGLGWIATIGVLPDQRGKGIGNALLQACEQAMALTRIRLSVRQSNYEAIRIYEKAGYRFVDHWLHYYNDGEDAVVMEKSIKESGL